MPANEDTGSPPELASLPKATTPGTSPWDWPMGLARTPHTQWGAWPVAAPPCMPGDKLMTVVPGQTLSKHSGLKERHCRHGHMLEHTDHKRRYDKCRWQR